jgi:hypothetical protein
MSESKLGFNENHLLQKIFFASLASWLSGRKLKVRLRGSRQEIDAVAAALLASKRFQEELSRPEASVASVMQKLKMKQLTAAQFEQVFGIPWPL